MKTTSFTTADREQIASLGLTVSQVEHQIENFRKGFPKIKLADAATTANGGITALDDKAISHYLNIFQKQTVKKRMIKFVPASGAASRMFKELFSFSATYFGVAGNFAKEFPEVKEFLEHLHEFAFYPDLAKQMERSALDIHNYMERGDYTTIINFLLQDQYLGYGSKPKALLKFHRYGALQRTPLEEHIVEGSEYAQDIDGNVRLHFTVSPQHRDMFRRKLREVKTYYEHELGIHLHVDLSEQRHYTDTIAVDEYNEPLRDEQGNLIFRPGGHGALLENLQDCNADIIFIKNIDNVVPDWDKHTTVVYKKVLAGMLTAVQERVHAYVKALADKNIAAEEVDRIERYAKQTLNLSIGKGSSPSERRSLLRQALDRPIRVCGMVRNQGEPGGGPFWVAEPDGSKSLQIVETAQINRGNPSQEAILQGATHFNPVDLVCGIKDYRGRRFHLQNFVDPSTGFISKKSKGAQVVKSQELPGLWNGSMARWITIFVEVPLATFNPVKTVNDLLRKEHRD